MAEQVHDGGAGPGRFGGGGPRAALSGAGVDPFDPSHKSDPHPVYHQLRAAAPVLRNPEMGESVLTRYDDCLAVLRDPRFSSSPEHRIYPEGAEVPDFRIGMSGGDGSGARVLLFLDPPDHTRLRKLVSKAFTPRTVERLRPHIAELVDGILDEAAERGELDVVADLGYTVPVTVICELMGVPVEDRHLFGEWSSDATRLFNGLFEDRRKHPGDDLVSALLEVEEEGDRLTEGELRSMVVLLFIAGHETTMNLIGNGAYALLRHPDQLRRWQKDPSLTPSAIEELLRYDGPVHVTGRIPTEDIEVNGERFHKGEQLVCLLAAANRDPARFDDPDGLDIGRPDNLHLTFSQGIHYCLGAALARVEGQVALSSLVQRFSELELLTDPVDYREHFVLRGLRELRVAVR
jgi:cytochrome P450